MPKIFFATDEVVKNKILARNLVINLKFKFTKTHCTGITIISYYYYTMLLLLIIMKQMFSSIVCLFIVDAIFKPSKPKPKP